MGQDIIGLSSWHKVGRTRAARQTLQWGVEGRGRKGCWRALAAPKMLKTGPCKARERKGEGEAG